MKEKKSNCALPETSFKESQVFSEPLFSAAWADSLVALWNAKLANARILSGAGSVIFEIIHDTGKRSCVLAWDENGNMRRRATSVPSETPRFRATEAEWREFILGFYSAVAGVLTGRIRYFGPMSYAFRFGPQFDRVAEVARELYSA